MNYNLKKFEYTNKRFENRITVTGSNAFGFPTRFFKENQIGTFNYVSLFYDEDQKVVGFHFHNNENEKHKYSILKSKEGYGGSIIATSFFKTYDLDPKRYKSKYNWEKKNIKGVGEVFIIKLKEGENNRES